VKSLLSTPAGAMRDADYFRQVKDVNFLTGKEVTAIDRKSRTVHVRDLPSCQEESYPYDKLVLATGALPVRPQLPGIDLGNVFVVRQPRDALAIKDVLTQLKSNRAVIIGAGPIGLELCEALLEWDLEVTVVEAQDQVFPGSLDFEMGAILRRHLESKGVGRRISIIGLAYPCDGPTPREEKQSAWP
jgi:NADPH-dependent 2,4-dienoyl-CoA reductase/sulfur reductase-like enzyme